MNDFLAVCICIVLIAIPIGLIVSIFYTKFTWLLIALPFNLVGSGITIGEVIGFMYDKYNFKKL